MEVNQFFWGNYPRKYPVVSEKFYSGINWVFLEGGGQGE